MGKKIKKFLVNFIYFCTKSRTILNQHIPFVKRSRTIPRQLNQLSKRIQELAFSAHPFKKGSIILLCQLIYFGTKKEHYPVSSFTSMRSRILYCQLIYFGQKIKEPYPVSSSTSAIISRTLPCELIYFGKRSRTFTLLAHLLRPKDQEPYHVSSSTLAKRSRTLPCHLIPVW